MSEPPGGSSALGIEAVEWIAEGDENLTVRITGRWRRRRPAWSAQPTLVIEGSGRRYRFPAIAEPPSLSGAGPGMWRISFVIPAALVPELGARSWLQFGAVVVPLPAAVRPMPEDGPGAQSESAHPQPDAAPSAPVSERVTPPSSAPLTGPPAAGPSASASRAASPGRDERVQALERELVQARARAAHLAKLVADQELGRRAGQKGARAERALREDLSRQLAARAQEAERGREAEARLVSTEERVRSLEQELREARERLAEATQQLQGLVPGPVHSELVTGLEMERGLKSRRTLETPRVPHEPSAAAVTPALPSRILGHAPLGSEPTGSVDAGAELAALRSELDARSRAEAGLQARVVEAEARLAAREVLDRQTGAVLAHLRQELDGLRDELARERAARRAAEARIGHLQADLEGARTRSQAAFAAIGELREALRQPGPEATAEPGPGSQVEPNRLNEALMRLREQVAPPPGADPGPPPGGEPAVAVPARQSGAPPVKPAPAPASPGGETVETVPGLVTVGHPWLHTAFRSLARADPDQAGRLVIELLPAQRAVYPRPVAYDLILGGQHGCLRVTAGPGSTEVVASEAPRSPAEVDFSITADRAALGRFLGAGPLRRRWGRGPVRVRGRRSALAALDALVQTQLGLGALHAAGVRLGPRTALSLIAHLVRPSWLGEEHFALGYQVPDQPAVYLVVRQRSIEVTETRPRGARTTTVSGPAGTLERVLSGDRSALGTVSGEDGPIVSLRRWLDRAQSE